MSNDLRNVDVAIVGGGIVGCAVALAARQAGLTAAILERGRVCGEASSVAAGLICGQYDADDDSPLVRLRLAGRDGFPEFAELLESLGGAPIGYLPGPTMGVALTDDERERLLKRVAAQREAGFDVEFIEPDEARRREPVLTPEVTGAAIYPDGQVDTHRWAPIVHRAVLAAGHVGDHRVRVQLRIQVAAGQVTEGRRRHAVGLHPGPAAGRRIVAPGLQQLGLDEAQGGAYRLIVRLHHPRASG